MIRKMIRLTALLLCASGLAAGFFFVMSRKTTGQWPHFPSPGNRADTWYSSPLFSADGSRLLFTRVEKQKNTEKIQAELWYTVQSGNLKQKLMEMPLKPHEELFVDLFDKDGKGIIFRKLNLADGERTFYRYDAASGKCYTDHEGTAGSDPASACPAGGPAVTIHETDGKRQDYSRIELAGKDGGREVIMSGKTEQDSFRLVGWSGDELYFHCHTPVNGVFHNQLWAWSVRAGKPSLVAEDAENVLVSPGGRGVAYLVPLARTQQRQGNEDEPGDRWQLVVKSSGEHGSLMPGKLNFADDCELYSWSPDGKYILFAKGRFLCLYDIEQGEEKKLVDAEKEGWWGYPLSPYNVAWSPDGRKLALLCYVSGGESRKLTEKIVLVAVNDGSRKVLHEDEPAKGKFSSDWSFHPHIAWAPGGDALAFEGRSRRIPQRTDIYLVKTETGDVKILSRGFLGLLDL